jgi:hypothetical protein
VKIPNNPLFKLGQVLLTPGALEVLQASGQSPWFFLTRHMKGDWGDFGTEDKRLNDEAVRNGSRILSAYTASTGAKLWVITEADHSATTILLPEEY